MNDLVEYPSEFTQGRLAENGADSSQVQLRKVCKYVEYLPQYYTVVLY